MIKMTVSYNVDDAELIEIISQEVKNPFKFIVALEESYEDWELAEKLAKHYTSAVTSLLTDEAYANDDVEWKKEFRDFLKTQLEKMEAVL